MHRLIRAALLLLAACSAAPPPQTGGFRNPGAGIYSNAVFRPERLAGNWYQVADFAADGAPACASGRLGVTPQGDGLLGIDANLCLGGHPASFRGQARISGPGRLALIGAEPGGLGAEWWVLWVDDGYRTLAIGTPSGDFGMILNREPALPADRMAAAREILAWNGYDLSRLRAFAP